MEKETELFFPSMAAGSPSPPPKRQTSKSSLPQLAFNNSPELHALTAKKEEERFQDANAKYKERSKSDLELMRRNLRDKGYTPEEIERVETTGTSGRYKVY